MKINGTPVPGKIPTKKLSGAGGKGGSSCLPALITIALLGGGWLSMLLTSWRAA